MRVAIYPRVSSRKQVEEGDSIDSQINRLKEFCLKNKFDIVKTYTDAGKSASIDEDKIRIVKKEDDLIATFNLNKRPAFKQMLKDAENRDFEGLVFFKWDRFSRNVIFSELARIYLERFGIELIPSDDDKDPLIRGIRSQLNQDEARKISDRVKLTQKNKFDNGIMTGKAPFGYKYNKSKKIMVVDEKKAQIVREVFQMTLEGQGYKKICEKYKLKPQSYYNIIKNPSYIGIIEFEGKVKKGNHSPIINEEVFKKCQKDN